MNQLQDKAIGSLAGAAIGDALGGATEGWTPEQIQERHGGWVEGIVGPFNENWREARPIAPYHKGDGHVTDDTLMTQALVEVYAKRRTHLDAYAVAEELVPLLIQDKRWVPELETDALLLSRIFLAEKWLGGRLHYGHVDPRGYLWLEHYAGGYLGRILNAHLYAIFGLRDYWQETNSDAARLVLEGAITTMRDNAWKYRRPGTWSWYNLVHRAAIREYHGMHIRQLRALAVASGDPYFSKLADDFASDYP